MNDPSQPAADQPEPDSGSPPAGQSPVGRDPTGHDPTGLSLARNLARSIGAAGRRRRSTRSNAPGAASLEVRSSGARPDDRDPQTLSAALDRLVGSRGWSTEVNLHVLLGRWPVLVGPTNADHSAPERYTDGVLTVRADSTAWASSLRLIAPQLVATLNAQLGQGTVTRVQVLGPDAPSWKHGRRSVRDGRGPRDTYG